MNNKLGGMYVQNEDERPHYNFSYSDNDGKHISVSFRADSEYDLDIIFHEIKNFLIASNHDVEGPIGELNFDDGDYANELIQNFKNDSDEVHAMTQSQAADKFSMDHLPNNGWPFGGLTTSALPAMTSVDLSSMTVTDLSTLTSKSWTEWSAPTMAPLTSRQVQSWSLSTEGIKALTSADISALSMPMPGTAGSAQYRWPDKDAY
jgi:hypothetical protein